MKKSYQTKWAPQPQQTLSLPQPPNPPLKLFRPIFYKLSPPGTQNKKKYTRLLKFNFRWGLFKTKLQNSPKNLPPLLSAPATPHLGPKSKIHLQHSVHLIKFFPKWYDMTQKHQKPQSNHISGKRPGCRPGPTPWGLGRGNTHPKVTRHQPSKPWKFHFNWPNCSKVNQHFTNQGLTPRTWPLGTLRGGGSNQK